MDYVATECCVHCNTFENEFLTFKISDLRNKLLVTRLYMHGLGIFIFILYMYINRPLSAISGILSSLVTSGQFIYTM